MPDDTERTREEILPRQGWPGHLPVGEKYKASVVARVCALEEHVDNRASASNPVVADGPGVISQPVT